MLSIRVFHQSDQALNDEFGVESRNPVVLDCLCTDLSSILLNVGVEDSGLEVNLGMIKL